ncbi:hypothetical protein N8368_00265 [Bacteroidia bacterium]|nr:hypothetical protein [Bacteroidia bacterium]MDB4107200.1 hypothetical protein [Bacteroidia bacterium]MDB9881885.1 hypothetical protein [Bacteroidia bacterium]MDC1394924.1 hypothetical protein [Bacteroidia bacterium]
MNKTIILFAVLITACTNSPKVDQAFLSEVETYLEGYNKKYQ